MSAPPRPTPSPTPSSDRPTGDGVSLFSTLDAFKNGLTSTLSLAAAADACRGWMAKIDAAGRPDLHGIRDLLGQLADELSDDRAEHGPRGNSIGDLMKRLGAHTSEAAGSIGEAHLAEPMKQLGGYLTAAGTALAGGTRPDKIAGVSTGRGLTPGDPALRTASAAPDVSDEALDPDRAAPDVSDEALDPDRAGVKHPTMDVADDVTTTPGDTTPGTKLNPA